VHASPASTAATAVAGDSLSNARVRVLEPFRNTSVPPPSRVRDGMLTSTPFGDEYNEPAGVH
jgi:hypothetical protein